MSIVIFPVIFFYFFLISIIVPLLEQCKLHVGWINILFYSTKVFSKSGQRNRLNFGDVLDTRGTLTFNIPKTKAKGLWLWMALMIKQHNLTFYYCCLCTVCSTIASRSSFFFNYSLSLPQRFVLCQCFSSFVFLVSSNLTVMFFVADLIFNTAIKVFLNRALAVINEINSFIPSAPHRLVIAFPRP